MMVPNQPGWVAVPVMQEETGERYHVVGWEDRVPVIATGSGISLITDVIGCDPYSVVPLAEWDHARSPQAHARTVADVVAKRPGINSSELRGILYRVHGVENQPAAIREAVNQELITIQDGGPGKAKRHYPC